MSAILLGLLAETPVHTGSGRALGLVDLPVAREAATDYPFIPGSGVKGSLRDKSEAKFNDDEGQKRVRAAFGDQENAGGLLVTDARLLLLPVRSLSGIYKWLTCPFLLERFWRDCQRAGLAATVFESNSLDSEWSQQLAPGKILAQDTEPVYLEERRFEVAGPVQETWMKAISKLIHYEQTRKRLHRQLAVVTDEDFGWFARFALQIQARNVLDDNKKTSQNLWYEEALPADTLMYTLLLTRERDQKREEHLRLIQDLFDQDPYLQCGGNETVGHGWFAVQLIGMPEGHL